MPAKHANNEHPDKPKNPETVAQLNGLLDALKYFHKNRVKLVVRWKRDGYVLTFSNPKRKLAPDDIKSITVIAKERQ